MDYFGKQQTKIHLKSDISLNTLIKQQNILTEKNYRVE